MRTLSFVLAISLIGVSTIAFAHTVRDTGNSKKDSTEIAEQTAKDTLSCNPLNPRGCNK